MQHGPALPDGPPVAHALHTSSATSASLHPLSSTSPLFSAHMSGDRLYETPCNTVPSAIYDDDSSFSYADRRCQFLPRPLPRSSVIQVQAVAARARYLAQHTAMNGITRFSGAVSARSHTSGSPCSVNANSAVTHNGSASARTPNERERARAAAESESIAAALAARSMRLQPEFIRVSSNNNNAPVITTRSSDRAHSKNAHAVRQPRQRFATSNPTPPAAATTASTGGFSPAAAAASAAAGANAGIGASAGVCGGGWVAGVAPVTGTGAVIPPLTGSWTFTSAHSGTANAQNQPSSDNSHSASMQSHTQSHRQRAFYAHPLDGRVNVMRPDPHTFDNTTNNSNTVNTTTSSASARTLTHGSTAHSRSSRSRIDRAATAVGHWVDKTLTQASQDAAAQKHQQLQHQEQMQQQQTASAAAQLPPPVALLPPLPSSFATSLAAPGTLI